MDKIMQFFGNNKDALTAIGVILTFFVSTISLYFSVRNNKAVHYVNSVTKNRVEWIYKLRELVAEFTSMVCIENNSFYISNSDGDMEKFGKHLSRTKELCENIKLMLNFTDEKDRKIIGLVDEIMDAFSSYYHDALECDVEDSIFYIETEEMEEQSEKLHEKISELTKLVQIYLKSEWNRVKAESKGETYEKETQEFDIWELEQKYDNPNYKNNEWKRFYIDTKVKIRRTCTSPAFCVILFFTVIIAMLMIA